VAGRVTMHFGAVDLLEVLKDWQARPQLEVWSS